ncbi:hypothetical protein GCK72_007091 [Caenorhabditis remanei]|uniref:Uncharacterized protein n=1 Tax=Caenorhabditis remanei TaxID=31234 RepID=A0A6A5HL74_CAERE|nr:hypothetical protein GCK72_007091 [Caenorhabditis remanei]KAF1767133.1 hypothetical protein GCK72_007091 [Caenorhabditis remanei]
MVAFVPMPFFLCKSVTVSWLKREGKIVGIKINFNEVLIQQGLSNSHPNLNPGWNPFRTRQLEFLHIIELIPVVLKNMKSPLLAVLMRMNSVIGLSGFRTCHSVHFKSGGFGGREFDGGLIQIRFLHIVDGGWTEGMELRDVPMIVSVKTMTHKGKPNLEIPFMYARILSQSDFKSHCDSGSHLGVMYTQHLDCHIIRISSIWRLPHLTQSSIPGSYHF